MSAPDTLLLEAAIEAVVAERMAELVSPLRERIAQLEDESRSNVVRYAALLDRVLYQERQLFAQRADARGVT